MNREEVIRRAFDNGVKKIINIGVDLATSKRSIEIAEGHENIFAAVGFHPDFFNEQGTVNSEQQKLFSDLNDLARNKKVVAIGEAGLDYFSHTGEIITDAQKENQKKGFLAQVELAQELNLPVIAHCREAWSDLYDIISKFKISASPAGGQDSKLVLHCYSGEKKDTEKFLKLPNVFFSFSGNITYPKPTDRTEKLAEAVQMVPLDRIMLDSDSPYLAPQAMRGKRNEPANVRYIAEKIAEIKGISVAQTEKETDENAEKFFGIG
ncbi:MAG: TatD family hydrolase [Candidatus Moranbacteria bacterium]|nr:TatD family hydrolase [Candidatus Moranbacteria bacterium]